MFASATAVSQIANTNVNDADKQEDTKVPRDYELQLQMQMAAATGIGPQLPTVTVVINSLFFYLKIFFSGKSLKIFFQSFRLVWLICSLFS